VFGWTRKTPRVPVSLAISKKVPIRGRYDAAQTTDDNKNHWLGADNLSPDAANTPSIRQMLRGRARYEVANNCYAKGIVDTLADDCIGTGPRLQLIGETDEVSSVLEAKFILWAKRVKLAKKLRTMRKAVARDGEIFALLITNKASTHDVKLDVQLIEAEQVASPLGASGASLMKNVVDGIKIDEFGNPVGYYLLSEHPGSMTSATQQGRMVNADGMLHWFKVDRAGQHRGIPEITPALSVFAELRRYTNAVIAAAETAADFAMVVYTDSPANQEAAAIDPMDTIELEKRMGTTLPEGWKIGGMKGDQPTTTYDMFVAAKINEAARSIGMPYNVAAGNSSGYNYASGRLDHQTYYKSIRVDQADLEVDVLDRILEAWLAEATKVYGTGDIEGDHQWFWDGHEHVDPAKEATAEAKRLESNTTTLAASFAKQGKDWEVELRQRGKEVALAKSLGIAAVVAAPETVTEQDVEDKIDEQQQDQA